MAGSNGYTFGSRTNHSAYGDWYGSRAFSPGGYPESWTAANQGSLPLKDGAVIVLALANMAMTPGVINVTITQEHNLLLANPYSTPTLADVALIQTHIIGLDSPEVLTQVAPVSLTQLHYLLLANAAVDVDVENIALGGDEPQRNSSIIFPRAMAFPDYELKLDRHASPADYIRLLRPRREVN